MKAELEELKRRLAQISDLSGAAGLLSWDQETFMPPAAIQARADQSSTLGGLAHQFFVDEQVGALLDELSEYATTLDYDSDDASLIRVKKREYDKLIRVPTDLVMELYATSAVATEAWKKARAENRFELFQSHLEKLLDIQIRLAEALGYESDNPYDALLDNFEPGMTYERINTVFAPLREALVALIRDITTHGKPVDDSVLHKRIDGQQQIEFSRRVVEALGFDFTHGRLDLSAHPFTGGPAYSDVRLTTRVKPDFLPSCLMAVIHESGHGMHHQGLSPSLYRSAIEHTGLATAESQSRFFENMVGRSRPFWEHWYPQLQQTFPRQFGKVSIEAFYRALNKVQPGLIRVEADEVTYGLHIMLRFELENDLINGRLKVKDLPEEWNDRMEAYLGIRPPTDSDGVLQDIHWSGGGMGYFPDYLLGSIFAALLWHRLTQERPAVGEDIRAGRFAEILAWLHEKIHRHGNKFTFPELVERVTGAPLRWEPYMDYLKTKFGEIYEL